VLVLEAKQLREQDEVPVAIGGASVAAAKARRDHPALALEDQERRRVRPDPRIARVVEPLLWNLRREPLGAGPFECGDHPLLELWRHQLRPYRHAPFGLHPDLQSRRKAPEPCGPHNNSRGSFRGGLPNG
jgi:hypothetical protein